MIELGSSENDIRRCALSFNYKQWQNTLMTNDVTRTARREKHDNNTKESLFK